MADLDKFELNGVGFGGEVEGLRFLGRSETAGYDYPSKGLQLDVAGRRLDGMIIAHWRDVDEDETLLFFEFESCEVQVELTPQGVPRVLVVTPEPLMADPEQRKQYRVTEPWPPPGRASAC